MKLCPICNEEQPEENFPFKNKRLGRRNRRCKECYNNSQRAYYVNTGQRSNQRIRTKRNRKKLKERYLEWKRSQWCWVCTETASECLDLHHLDPTQKDFEVSKLASSCGSWKKIEQEIAKCAVLCSNCHRKVHSGRIVSPHSSMERAPTS